MPSIRLVMGLPVSTNAATDGGWLNSSDVTWLIGQLQTKYPNQFGGVMAWSAEHDASDNGYTWSNEVWTNLKPIKQHGPHETPRRECAWTPLPVPLAASIRTPAMGGIRELAVLCELHP
jgi:hypothetical protein